ncbi:MAG: pyruvate kinase [Lactobacillus panisapium]|uniref:Pyruvate kinase n=1 Tax=Lactobacillus panisapium TaxID=2012495 RepID=A0ABX8W4V9_9LACO|nr:MULTISPECIES: pyruvate kinase [Lactobacillus]MCO6530763.1 pyruvate kinase [Lactobacillus sp.]MCO6532620.1 pyruvate kinase [Lactobacillus sp.]MCO6534952.1 pyruvate kinase [Lactobacillus sp.]MCT6820712.1 pyruvate kinase [Lactobacillus panisapium]MCT6853225.1 pyruvate kinase [Lactobacillus panisapium]
MKKTKIVSTLGPASNDIETITALAKSGVNVFRFNFSHGDHAEHLSRMKMVRQVEKETGLVLGIALDTKGAEIRTTDQEGGKFTLNTGDKIRVSMDATKPGNKDMIHVTYDGLYDDTHVGGHVLIDDGLVDLLIKEKDDANRELVCEAQNTGVIGSKKGVNAPGVEIRLPGITEKDTDDIKFGLEHGINFIFASFARKAQDILDIRKLCEEAGCDYVKIYPKIESQEGIDNADEILQVSDGLMVARGDMGVEIPFIDVPFVQKDLIKRANALGKPVITATQMLDSMQENPRPTRAEVSDVANAVLDGTDATMLSGESANGLYPVKAVSAMAEIDERTEQELLKRNTLALQRFEEYKGSNVTEAIGESVVRTAQELGVKTIITATNSGYTARMISKYRPNANILALTFDEKIQHSLGICWGVQPMLTEKPESTDDMFEVAAKVAKEQGYVKDGDLVIIVAGVPVGDSGTTNLMKLQIIGSKLAQGLGVGNGSVVGKTVVVNSAEEAISKTKEGDILVAKTTDPDYMPAIKKASGLVVEASGLTSHAAVVGLSLGIPVVVGVTDATEKIAGDTTITVDARRGAIYQGEVSNL